MFPNQNITDKLLDTQRYEAGTPFLDPRLFQVCPSLGLLNHGSVQQEGIAIGDTATYVCDAGYDITLSPSAVNPRVCQADGTWTGDDNGYSCSVGEYLAVINKKLEFAIFEQKCGSY